MRRKIGAKAQTTLYLADALRNIPALAFPPKHLNFFLHFATRFRAFCREFGELDKKSYARINKTACNGTNYDSIQHGVSTLAIRRVIIVVGRRKQWCQRFDGIHVSKN